MLNRWNHKFNLSKKVLYQEYIINKKSITQIADLYKFNYVSIYNWLNKYNIKLRTRRESHIGKKRPEHSERMMGKGNPMSGTKRPLSVRLKISKGRKGKYGGRNSPMFGKKQSYKCSFGKGGKYKNTWFRSSYEIAYAKYLCKNKIKWQYEPIAFDLVSTTYRPDFYLPKTDEYIEIKGYWTLEAKEKFKLFRYKFPEIKIAILNQKELINRRIL